MLISGMRFLGLFSSGFRRARTSWVFCGRSYKIKAGCPLPRRTGTDPVVPNSVYEFCRKLVAERGLKWKARLA
ncbi:hypothetical protein J6590_095678, partial [Homalodisca vitripennis]